MKGLFGILFFWMGVVALPSKALATDPPTCQLNNKFGEVHQTVCHGETDTIKAISTEENAPVQWFRQNNTGGWTAITDATNTELTTGQGIYKAIFTFSDSSTCETNVDTVSYWKAYQIDWEVTACRAGIVGAMALPFPQQNGGQQEAQTPVDPNEEINFSWQVIPEPVQASFQTSSTSIFPLTDGFFQDTTLGLHQVILTVSQQGSSCISVDTMEVNLLPLHVWADTIISYGGQPAIAVAHASGGTEPYQYTWSNADSCLTGNCDSAQLAKPDNQREFTVVDYSGCSNHGFARRDLSTNNLSDGWVRFLPNVFQYSMICGDSLSGEILLKNKALTRHLKGSANPLDSLEISSPNQFKQTELFEEISDFKAFLGHFEQEGSVWVEMEGPRIVHTDLNIFINDTIIFSGDSTHLFSFSSQKKIILGSGSFFKYNGIKPNQILFYSKEGIEVHSQKGISPGILISEGNISIFSNKTKLRGCYSMANVLLKAVEKDYFTDIASPLSTDAQILSFGCEVGVADNGYSLICNGGFEEVESGSQSGPIPASANLRGWGFSGSNGPTPDLYWKSENCFSPRPCGGCFDLPTNSMSRTIGIQPFENHCIGMYPSSPFGAEYYQTDLISPTIQNNYYFINLFASPATSMERKTKQESLQLTNQDNAFYPIVFGSNSNHLDFLINGQWKELFRFFRADGAFSRLGLGNVQNAPSRNNPDFDGCDRYKNRSYTYYDGVGLYRMPRVRPCFQIPCSTSTFTFTLFDPSDEEAVNGGLVDALVQLGISFEWRKGTQIISDDYFAQVSNVEAPAQFQLFARYQGEEAQIGTVVVSLEDAPVVQFSATPTPFCPGRATTFSVINPNSSFEYHWSFSNGTSATGPTVSNPWLTEGNQTIILISSNPNDPNFCPIITEMTIPVWSLPAAISVKDRVGIPIEVCEEVEELELIADLFPNAISYTWLNVSDNGNILPLGVTQGNTFMLTLPEIVAPDNMSTIRVRVIIQFSDDCQRVGELEINRYANPFDPLLNPMQISYLNNQTQGNWVPLNNHSPLVLCSGVETIFSAFFEGGANPGAIYTWSIGSGTTIVNQQILVSGWPVGTYQITVRATDGHGNPCQSPVRIFEITITNPKNLAVNPIPISGFPNDFDLQASFNTAGLTSLSLIRAGQGQNLGEASNGLISLNIYQPGNSLPAIPYSRPDGIYSFIAKYADGCHTREDFTLIGRRWMLNTTYTRQGELTGSNQVPLSGNVYMHHNVTFNSGTSQGTLKIDKANIFARGETQYLGPCVALPGFVCPEEEVTGTFLTVTGSNSNLTISKSEFKAIDALNRMWGGIRVNGINSFTFGSLSADPFENRILDAFTGLEIGVNPCTTLNIFGNRFENCYRGLICNSTRSSQFAFTNFIKNCTVASDPGHMKPPYHPRSSNPNHQFITQTGMLLQGTSQFPLLTEAGQQVATFSNNTFETCMEGVRIELSTPTNAVDVRNCVFTDNRNGGIVSSGGLNSIGGCIFNMPATHEAYANLGYSYSSGIRGYNASMTLTSNTFLGIGGNHSATSRTSFGVFEEVEEGLTRALNISGNTFRDLHTSISLNRLGEETATIDLTMRCNNFEQTTEIPTGQERIGLFIGEGVSLTGNRIGGDETPATGNASPNSNYWPRIGGGLNPNPVTNYISILNESANELGYWGYGNEYLGTVVPDENSNEPNSVFLYDLPNKYSVTQATIANFCGLYSGDCNYATTGDCEANILANSAGLGCTNNIQWVSPCSGGVLDQTVFPVFRPLPDTTQHSLIMAQQERFGDKPFLGQSIPNPGNQKVLIPVFLPWDADGAILSVVESATGRQIKTIPLAKKGAQMAELETSQWPTGMYHYQLLLRKGDIPKPMKMVLIR